MRLSPRAAVLVCFLALAALALLDREFAVAQSTVTAGQEQIELGEAPWAGSVSVGSPVRGALFRGVQLPPEGTNFFTWDFPLKRSPNRGWRRWAIDRTIARVLSVLSAYRLAHPLAPRVGIADLSRPHGGDFGKRFGGLGHSSHQNGVDVDILYPRRDLQERSPAKVRQIDRALAQDLVDRFAAAGATDVFVGPRTRLTGPKKVVQKLIHHDDHMHVRFSARGTMAVDGQAAPPVRFLRAAQVE